jgi:hypothetical protein
MSPDRPLGTRDFTDGTRRPVHADPDGRQWVPGNDGERVEGTSLVEGPAAAKPGHPISPPPNGGQAGSSRSPPAGRPEPIPPQRPRAPGPAAVLASLTLF